MFNGHTFGVTNGIVTMLSLLIGLYATGVQKVGIIGAIVAMLISDPLADAYAIYNAELQRDSKKAYDAFKKAFSSQALIQLAILIIVVLTPDIKSAVYISVIIGFFTIIAWDFYIQKKHKDILKNIILVFGIIFITFCIDKQVYKYFTK